MAPVMTAMVAPVMTAMMASVMAAMMTVMMMMGSSATKVDGRSAVIVARARFIAGPDPAIAVPSSLTYQMHWFGQLTCNRGAQSTICGHRVCPRADERSCADECRHSSSC